ncbi:cytoskeleton-associated protein 2 isoform X2 [Sceloporus undulatus]|uniref:cytoskeleton-associated protein 2 isoform X2 n=1 Tax=Sceloporus undulatus TaxID=8520 RepID=UPI001C4B3449|nr:cytoskeleton-associated protein 2 isoform X2 [Sceloporus undulatus]
MEDKENVNGSAQNRLNSTLGGNIISPKPLKSPTVLKQIDTATNCNPLSGTTAVSDPAENKNKGTPFSKTFSLNRNAKEKQLKITTPNPGACLSEKRVLGSYRGRIVSSKINSFRKVPENESKRYSLAVPPKSVVRTGTTESSKCTRDTQITSTVGASKPEVVTLLQNRPTVRVSVSHPKAILSHEKQSLSSALVHKGEAQINPVRNWKPVSKAVPPNTNNSVHRTKKPSVSKTVRESLARPLSETRSTVSASKSVDKRNSIRARSSEVRRTQLAEWQSRKGIKKPPAPVFAVTQTEIETVGQTVKEPAKSFWAAIAEEDEQGIVSDGVNKTLAECLSLIETGYAGEAVHSTLQKLILQVPDAKKLAKYWVCQMRLEQFRSTEKVLGIYESAILAGAQPKDELRHALADAMKATTNLRKSDECVRKEITQNDEAKEVNLDKNKIDTVSKEAPLNKNTESSNEENFPNAADVCLKSEQENSSVEKSPRNEQSCKPALCKKEEESDSNTDKDELLEFKTPENDNMGSFLIKYNLSTTPYLESAKKKLQCEVNDSAVKDLKYLTPVRRSRRIDEKKSKLPKDLKERNLCVSSLQELGEMGDDGTGFIYRQNSALQKVYPQELSKE